MISETKAIDAANRLKHEFALHVRDSYEHRAKSCLMCETLGVCCTDAHFVNVRISRLEAAAIRNVIGRLPEERRAEVRGRIDAAIEKYKLSADANAAEQKFACPLFEKGVGCLVHNSGKPLPCIQHACYERKEDLPPDQLLEENEAAVERLNRRVYGGPQGLLPLPVAVKLVSGIVDNG
ncbi:MAG TPA: hypothetical protein VHL50_00305 [Pyrinomonadaceae bacterium]|nr:hypothetical protein [Pyrinomonadaceae bacterium]